MFSFVLGFFFKQIAMKPNQYSVKVNIPVPMSHTAFINYYRTALCSSQEAIQIKLDLNCWERDRISRAGYKTVISIANSKNMIITKLRYSNQPMLGGKEDK